MDISFRDGSSKTTIMCIIFHIFSPHQEVFMLFIHSCFGEGFIPKLFLETGKSLRRSHTCTSKKPYYYALLSKRGDAHNSIIY